MTYKTAEEPTYIKEKVIYQQKASKKQDVFEVTSKEDANSIFITRGFFERYHLLPEFDNIAIGALVRVKIGDVPNTVYRLCVIDELKTGSRTYDFGGSKINRVCILNHGSSQKTFTFDFLSNSHFTEKEYEEWIASCQRKNYKMPSRNFCKKKSAEIIEISKIKFDDAVINNRLKRKAEFSVVQSVPRYTPAQKFDSPAKRTKSSYISFNRSQEETHKEEFDPFSRRKCRPLQLQETLNIQSDVKIEKEVILETKNVSKPEEKTFVDVKKLHEKLDLEIDI